MRYFLDDKGLKPGYHRHMKGELQRHPFMKHMVCNLLPVPPG